MAMKVLGIDSGGVLTTNSSGSKQPKPEGDKIWKATAPGAWPFLCIAQERRGRKVVVISRVNYPSPSHWVTRHCASVGLYNVELVRDRHEKGPVALENEVDFYVDDAADCLYHVAMSCHDHSMPGRRVIFVFLAEHAIGHPPSVLGTFGCRSVSSTRTTSKSWLNTWAWTLAAGMRWKQMDLLT